MVLDLAVKVDLDTDFAGDRQMAEEQDRNLLNTTGSSGATDMHGVPDGSYECSDMYIVGSYYPCKSGEGMLIKWTRGVTQRLSMLLIDDAP